VRPENRPWRHLVRHRVERHLDRRETRHDMLGPVDHPPELLALTQPVDERQDVVCDRHGNLRRSRHVKRKGRGSATPAVSLRAGAVPSPNSFIPNRFGPPYNVWARLILFSRGRMFQLGPPHVPGSVCVEVIFVP
jgi:hypothetical protein